MISAGDVASLAVDDAARGRLAHFIRRLLERNDAINLTGARDVAAVLAHVRDSLSIADRIGEPHVDVGSGGGFPAVPLAIVTGRRMSLIESATKKAAFLREIVAELGLAVEVHAVRAEEAGRDQALRGKFASATARAVATVPAVLELTLPLLCVGGVAVLQRGRFDPVERRATSDALLVLGGELLEEVPGTGEDRRVLIVRKVAPTQARFPRRPGIPAKRPLCLHGD
jgi:16S rRNA (guanine527-N7)-methyltransferase